MVVVDVAADKPPWIKFKITEASITQFDITSDNTLYYKFKITITAKNFKNEIKYFEKKMDAISSYKGNQLSSMTLEPFVLGSTNTVTLQPIVFEGNSLIKLVPKELVIEIIENGYREIEKDLR
ncbi:NDR1/HIN1 protein [Trifolium repens]|nr:NDR1/HIN1 protein [Trifolium repens]